MSLLRTLGLSAVVCTGLAALACKDDSGAIQIRGGERLGWDQSAGSLEQVRAMTFRLYLDGNLSTLASTSCSDQAGAAGYLCSGNLPIMTAGRHTLEVTAVLNGQESARSARLIVSLSSGSSLRTISSTATANASDSASLTPRACTTTGCYDVSVIASDREFATAFTTARDGSVFFIEGGTRVGIISEAGLIGEPALQADPGSRIVGLALDDDREGNQWVFVSATESTRDGTTVLNITRYRALQNILGEGARVVTGLPFMEGAFAPLSVDDSFLYVALPAVNNELTARNRATDSGTVLRFTRDGLTPTGNTRVSPRYVDGFAWPTTLTLDGSSNLWAAGRSSTGAREVGTMPVVTAAALRAQTASLNERRLDRLESQLATPSADVGVPDPVVTTPRLNTMLIVSGGQLFRSAPAEDGSLPLDEVKFEPDVYVLGAVVSQNGFIYASYLQPDGRSATIVRLRRP